MKRRAAVLLAACAGLAGCGGGSTIAATSSTTTPSSSSTAPTSSPAPSPSPVVAAPVTTVAAVVPTVAPTSVVPANNQPTDAQLIQTACGTFRSSVASVIQANVAADDLAPIIRVHMGENPDGTTTQSAADAPYFVANSDASEAAMDDSTYQPLVDALQALDHAIIDADPSSDLHEIAEANSGVLDACQRLHA